MWVSGSCKTSASSGYPNDDEALRIVFWHSAPCLWLKITFSIGTLGQDSTLGIKKSHCHDYEKVHEHFLMSRLWLTTGLLMDKGGLRHSLDTSSNQIKYGLGEMLTFIAFDRLPSKRQIKPRWRRSLIPLFNFFYFLPKDFLKGNRGPVCYRSSIGK